MCGNGRPFSPLNDLIGGHAENDPGGQQKKEYGSKFHESFLLPLLPTNPRATHRRPALVRGSPSNSGGESRRPRDQPHLCASSGSRQRRSTGLPLLSWSSAHPTGQEERTTLAPIAWRIHAWPGSPDPPARPIGAETLRGHDLLRACRPAEGCAQYHGLMSAAQTFQAVAPSTPAHR